MNTTIITLLTKIRQALETTPSIITFAEISFGADNIDTISLPAAEYADFLRVSNGIRCGIVDLFGTDCILKNQHTAELINGGQPAASEEILTLDSLSKVTLSPASKIPFDGKFTKRWFCIGQVLYQTLAIDLLTHNVYLFYDSYFYDDRTESNYRNFGSFDNFLTDFILGERYSELIPGLNFEDDRWYNFMKEINLI